MNGSRINFIQKIGYAEIAATAIPNIVTAKDETGTMKHFFFILLYAFLNLIFNSSDSCAAESETSVLFLGNSNVRYNDLPSLFSNLTKASDKIVYTDSYTMDGSQLADHVTNQDVLSKIRERKWDFVVLIGSSMRVAYPDSFVQKPVKQALIDLKKIIAENNDSAKMIYCMPWAYEDGMTWLNGWTDDYIQMQEIIYDNTLRLKNDVDFRIAPVGWAWYNVLRENDYPLHLLHTDDWSHPNLAGSYLTACVIFVTLFNESCSGNLFYSTLPPEIALNYQEIASETVLDNLVLWNIEKAETSPESDKIIEVEQNYPNPFITGTTIIFEVFKSALVEVVIYNMEGKQVLKPVNTYLIQGIYNIEIGAGTLKKGNYIYKIKAKNVRVVKKMIVI